MTHSTSNNLRNMLKNTPAERLSIPMAYADPAFQQCLLAAIDTSEMVENFDRLTGCQISRIGKSSVIEQMIDKATGYYDDQLRQFAEFVHECIYLRMPDEVIHAFRMCELCGE